MKSIGGYFELELNNQGEFHTEAIKVNTGRNALEYILKVNNYNKIYIPFYTCDVLLEPIEKLGLSYEFYSIDSKLEPIFNFEDINEKEVFLYTNYFGLKDNYISELNRTCHNLIIDNAQAFFSKPNGFDSFNSVRKFFGTPEGAYLYSKCELKEELEENSSPIRIDHLVKRIEYGSQMGYNDFINNEDALMNNPIRKMSKLTSKILKSVDYSAVINQRKRNFNYLHENLNFINEFKFQTNNKQVPMCYPFLEKNNESKRNYLIENKIFVAKYWPNVTTWCEKDSFEFYLSENLLALPIDHRYDNEDMKRIVKLIIEK